MITSAILLLAFLTNAVTGVGVDILTMTVSAPVPTLLDMPTISGLVASKKVNPFSTFATRRLY